jgi:transposase
MNITTIGLDLAKSVFQVHGVDEAGKVVLKKRLKRSEVLPFFGNLTACLIGIEACAAAHYWARKLIALGHDVKLMAPQFVKPYVKANKNDARDAEGICEAVSRPSMRFVPVKTPTQQTMLSLHRARQAMVKARTAQANQLRGLLGEFGIVIAQGIRQLAAHVPDILEDADNALPGLMRALVQRLWEHFQALDRQVAELDQEIKRLHREDEASRRLAEIPGIGYLTASALAATVGDAKAFVNGRQLAAWLGLVPRQHSSGGKELHLGISKRGDCYVRTLLIHGARSVIQRAERRNQPDGWLKKLIGRRHKNVATVAVANKNARIAWAILAHDRDYETGYQPLWRNEHGLPTGGGLPA